LNMTFTPILYLLLDRKIIFSSIPIWYKIFAILTGFIFLFLCCWLAVGIYIYSHVTHCLYDYAIKLLYAYIVIWLIIVCSIIFACIVCFILFCVFKCNFNKN
jgi:hypothetical protein